MASSPRSARWLRMEYLFHAALELEPDGRAAFLDEACAGDADLRREVETLLQSSGETMGFLQNPVLYAAQEITAGDQDRSGECIGAYRLVRVLGEGGMAIWPPAPTTFIRNKLPLRLCRAVWDKTIRSYNAFAASSRSWPTWTIRTSPASWMEASSAKCLIW
jgi:hypothetical protein